MTLGAKRPADDATPVPNQERLGEGGRYQIRRRIGVGGMAEVYKAVDTRLGNRSVAIKTLSRKVAKHPFADRLRGLFMQEAQALSRVKDDNVVNVLDFGAASDGTPYMVMEFLNGTDLSVLLKRDGRLATSRAVDVVLGVCAGVHACHLAGIIHRDLKPANVFLAQTAQGEQAKVLDFSVAKVPIARSVGGMEQPRTDLIVGTPSYMSPEQALGEPAGELSDQYSIGALLYRCLTGMVPQGVLLRPREYDPEIPERLELALLRALDATPGKRFGSVHDLGQGLLAFASPEGRGRWRPYYRSAPLAIDPTTTGTLAPVFAADGIGGTESPVNPRGPSSAATLETAPDVGNEQREGNGIVAVEADASLAAPAMVTRAEFGPVDLRSQEKVSFGNGHGAIGERARASTSALDGKRVSRRLFGALVAVAALVLCVTILETGRRSQPSPAPVPPQWLREVPAATVEPPALVSAAGSRPAGLSSSQPPTIEPLPLVVHLHRRASRPTRKPRMPPPMVAWEENGPEGSATYVRKSNR